MVFLTKSPRLAHMAYRFVRSLLESAVMSPLVEFTYLSFRALKHRRNGAVGHPITAEVFWTLVSLAVAVTASGAFLIWNGYAFNS